MLTLTSWDDGHPLDLRLAETLRKYGLAGTFFAPIENREGRPVMGGEQLRELDQCFEVGSHTLTHHYLSDLSQVEMTREISEGKRLLEDELGHPVPGFCYPGGHVDNEIARLVESAGFRYARTIENMRFDLGKDPWHVPTSFQFYPHGYGVLTRNFLRYPARSKIPLVAHRLGRREFGAFLRQVAERCARLNGIFHLWGHSWEIEEQGLWAELEHFLGYLSTLSSRSITLAQAIAESSLIPER